MFSGDPGSFSATAKNCEPDGFADPQGARPRDEAQSPGEEDGAAHDFGHAAASRPDQEAGEFAAVLEKNRRLKEALYQKQSLLVGLAEELHGPMEAILEWASLVRDGRTTRRGLDDVLEHIEVNAQLQSNIIQDVLDLYQAEQGTLELNKIRLDVRDQVKRAVASVSPFAAAYGVAVLAVTPRSPCEIAGDPTRIRQILIKLLLSAVNRAPSLGVISVRCKQGNGKIQIAVEKTGGISEGGAVTPGTPTRFLEDMDFTAAESALGLSLARKITEIHAGKIVRESSDAGEITNFVLEFPKFGPARKRRRSAG